MVVDWLGTLFLYLHIGGVIVAFGPTIAFPVLAARAAKEPMHGSFTLRASEWITERIVEPGAVFVFLMGVGLIVTRGYDLTEDLWVTLSIVLFLITIGFSYFVQLPVLRKMIALTSQAPAVTVSSDPQAPAASGGAAPPGPPPEFLALSARAARGGQFMSVMLFVMLALMVVKPF